VIAISRSVPLERAHEVTEEVERVIAETEPGADVMVHVEPLADEKAIRERVLSITAREERVQQVHNIAVTMQPDGHHISLHAKFPGGMSLAEAHSIAEVLEGEIVKEVAGVARVDTHLEPLEPSGTIAADVTQDNAAMVDWIRQFAEAQPEVQDCHEIVISKTRNEALQIVMHCEGAPGLSVASVHDASTRVEDAVHSRWPAVHIVTVHFEPARIS
jgi:divalent metal cation (Fe/Co/Zn/Cd) transporter